MSRLVGNQLTEALMGRLSGADLDTHEGKIIPIFTLDERGWPHPALLSYYEVRAKDASTLDLALWKDSSTAKHLRRTGVLTVMITDEGVNYYLKGSVQQLESEMAGAPQVSRFRMTIEQLVEDQEPNAVITTGMTYRRLGKRDADDFAVKVFHLLSEGKN
ncbi:MAG TPA: hypothetical protein VNI35_05620 [Nitrospira sp.]|nr:hypothetical protein [Nitrospira sp.]